MQANSIDRMKMRELQRFLLTGCESGVYRAGEIDLNPQRCANFVRTLAALGPETVDMLLNMENSRADATLFALALSASPRFASKETNTRALAALPLAARKADHLITFAAYAGKVRGWGRGLRSAIAEWYVAQPVSELASQILRQPGVNLKRHRSVLRRAHPKSRTLIQNALFQWISDGRLGHLATPEIRSGELRQVEGFEQARRAVSAYGVIDCIHAYRLNPSQIPSRWKTSADVWEALFDHLTYRQLIRYLPAMTESGFLSRRSAYSAIAVARIADRGRLRNGVIHPLRIVEAMKRYRSQSRPVETVFDALEEAFHLAVDCQAPIAKRLLVGIDGTGSMQGAPVHGMCDVPASLAGAGLALALTRAGAKGSSAVVFHRDAKPLDFNKRTRLADALNQIRATPSRSDASAPIRYARNARLQVDAFVIATDRLHQDSDLLTALRDYRESSGINAQLVLLNLAAAEVPGWIGGEDMDVMALAGLDHHATTSLRAFLAMNCDNEN
jgi:60 kDa SS-A/Ro ribonucleoprotein